ncbi:MAG: phage tail protein [Oscillospiraceae bacterium]|nr:phage tail protein [Oscillospiraceae bacterium]
MSDLKRFTNLGGGVYRQYNEWQTKGTSKGKYDAALEREIRNNTGVNPYEPKTSRISGIVLDIDNSAVARAHKVLAGIEGGFYRAVGSAMKRAFEHGRTAGLRAVSDRYTAGQNVIRRYMGISNTTEHDYGSVYTVSFGYRGHHIPLMEFDTKIGKDGRVVTRVLRNSVRKTLDNAFISSGINKHFSGVFERIGPGRYPIRQIYGPAATQAFSDDDTQQLVGDAIMDAFDKRIEHEITRVLAGIGG